MIWVEGEDVRDGVRVMEFYCSCCGNSWSDTLYSSNCPKCGADHNEGEGWKGWQKESARTAKAEQIVRE